MTLSQIVEAYLVASEDPLTSDKIVSLVKRRVAEAKETIARSIADADPDTPQDQLPTLPDDLAALEQLTVEEVETAIEQLNTDYESSSRAFAILPRAKGWRLFTRPAYSGFVAQLFPERKRKRLSPPATETLAIIAYRQPVSKSAIDAVRGVSSDGMLQKLLDLELIHVSGRADLPGRPLLYSTTDLFFEHFGVSSIDELPNADALRKVSLPTAPDDPTPEPQEQQLNLGETPTPAEEA